MGMIDTILIEPAATVYEHQHAEAITARQPQLPKLKRIISVADPVITITERQLKHLGKADIRPNGQIDFLGGPGIGECEQHNQAEAG